MYLVVRVNTAVIEENAAYLSIEKTHTHTHTHTEREREREREMMLDFLNQRFLEKLQVPLKNMYIGSV